MDWLIFCRHSDSYYSTLNDDRDGETVLQLLVQLCGDLDGATRKFACFAG